MIQETISRANMGDSRHIVNIDQLCSDHPINDGVVCMHHNPLDKRREQAKLIPYTGNNNARAKGSFPSHREKLVQCNANDTELLVMDSEGKLFTTDIGDIFTWNVASTGNLFLEVSHPTSIICGGDEGEPRRLTNVLCSNESRVIVPQGGTVVAPVVYVGCSKGGDDDIVTTPGVFQCPQPSRGGDRMSAGSYVSVRCNSARNEVPLNEAVHCTASGSFYPPRACVQRCDWANPLSRVHFTGKGGGLYHDFLTHDERRLRIRCSDASLFINGKFDELELPCDESDGMVPSATYSCEPPQTCKTVIVDRVTNDTRDVYVSSGTTQFVFEDKVQCTCLQSTSTFNDPASCNTYEIEYPHVPQDAVFRVVQDGGGGGVDDQLYAEVPNETAAAAAKPGHLYVFRDPHNYVNNPYVNITGNTVICVGERAHHVIRYTLVGRLFDRICGFQNPYPPTYVEDGWVSCGPLVLYYLSKMRMATVNCNAAGGGAATGGRSSTKQQLAVHYFFEHDQEPLNVSLPHYVRVDKAYMIHKYMQEGGGILYGQPEVYNALCSQLYVQTNFKAHYDSSRYSCSTGRPSLWHNATVRKKSYMLVVALGVSLIVTLFVSIICCMGVQSLKKDFALAKKTAELDKTMYEATVHKQRLQARLEQRRAAAKRQKVTSL